MKKTTLKRIIAIALVAVMMMTAMPSLLASAADAATVVAQEDLENPLAALSGFFELWGGLLKMVFGADFLPQLFAALKEIFVGGMSLGDFFDALKAPWVG